MLPADHRSESGFFSRLGAMFNWADKWVRQEIVDDDPWDQETLFPDSQTSLEEPAELTKLDEQPSPRFDEP